ncbi:JAB domain-containing protein [Natronincola ferrireducens]|uniref:DNA repair protein RadC n=1 Tax=Natronincola ferrireducens TaxID=393762 RepID=A0A1G9A958_9FIRM|nr:JAB domain-containing protein [Natronincola ferrireducens]SDK23902.1 DNA repair protein RadC [Natronincola ferrireducens]
MSDMKIPVVRLKMVKEYDLSADRNKVYGIEEAAPIFESLIGGSTLERLALLCMDANNHPINVAVLNIGNNRNVEVVPSEIFRIAILSNATSIIICHNHPSGILKPSKYDMQITKKIGQIASLLSIQLIDSLILGDFGKCLSIRSEIGKKEGEINDKC